MTIKPTRVTLYCPDCGSDKIRSKSKLPGGQSLDYYRCDTCKVYFTWPLQPKRISKGKRDAMIKLFELGLRNKDISYALNIKPDTVCRYRKRLLNDKQKS